MPGSGERWTLDLDAEAGIFVPWVDSGPDPITQKRVTDWIAELALDPLGRGVEEAEDVFSVRVPGTKVAVVWTLDVPNRRVILAHIGPA